MSYKLTYFNMRGRAEIPRLILLKNGIKFEDVRLELNEWPAYKASRELPFGQLPTLEIEGKLLFQSPSICRFLGKRFGMYGKDEFEEAKIGAVFGTMEDVCRMPLDVGYDVENEDVKAELRIKFRKVLPEYLGYLEKMVENDNGYFVGNSMTVADLVFFVYIDFTDLIDNVVIDWAKFPKLKKVRDNVSADPNIAAWLKIRPITEV